jgi:hypothetical protein
MRSSKVENGIAELGTLGVRVTSGAKGVLIADDVFRYVAGKHP